MTAFYLWLRRSDDLLREFWGGYTRGRHIYQRVGPTGTILFGEEVECQTHHYRDRQCLISCTWIFMPASWCRALLKCSSFMTVVCSLVRYGRADAALSIDFMYHVE